MSSADQRRPEIGKIIKLWEQYKGLAVGTPEANRHLDIFLKFLVGITRNEHKIQRFELDTLITKDLSLLLAARVSEAITKATSPAPEHRSVAVLEYLASPSGSYLLWAVELLTKRVNPTLDNVRGLPTAIASALECVFQLPSSYLVDSSANSSVTKVDPQLIAGGFCSVSLPPVATVFDSPPVLPPSLVAAIMSAELPHQQPQRSRSDSIGSTSHASATAPQKVAATDQQSLESAPGILSYHLLAVLGNLIHDDCALTELAGTERISTLVNLFTVLPRPMNPGLVTMQRQLVRTLARLFSSAVATPRWVSLLNSQNTVQSLIETLQHQNNSLPNIVLLELSEMLSLFVVASTIQSSWDLMRAFFQADGYTIFAKNLGAIGKTGTKDQQRSFVGAYCQLLFIRQDEENLDSMIYTVNFFNKLLSLFADAHSLEFKTILLYALSEIVSLNLHRSEEFMELGVFNILFRIFDSFTTHLRRRVLKILKRVLSATAASKQAGLLESELPFLVGLLQGSRSSSVILVCQFITKMIALKRLSRAKLANAKLLSTLLEFIVVPSQSRFAKSLLSQIPAEPSSSLPETTIKADEPISEAEELKISLDLISTLESKATKKERDHDVNSPPVSTTDFHSHRLAAQPSPVQRPLLPSRTTGATPEQTVQYSVVYSALALLRTFLLDNTKSQEEFITNGGLVTLYQLMDIAEIRPVALESIAVVAIGDILLKTGIVSILLDQLQLKAVTSAMAATGEGSTEPILAAGRVQFTKAHLKKNLDILACLRSIFRSSDHMRDAFRECGAFGSIISFIAQASRPTDPDIDELTFSFIIELLETITSAMKYSRMNQDFFKSQQLYSALSLALHKSPFGSEVKYLIRLADALISMSVSSTWPPTCPLHPKDRPEKSSTPALTIARERAEGCANCRESLLIENPEFIKLLLELLVLKERSNPTEDLASSVGAAISTNTSQSSIDTQNSDDIKYTFIVIAKSLKLLADNPQNAHILSTSGVVLYILTNMRQILTREQFNKAKSRQPVLLALVERIASYSMSLPEFRKYMELLRSPNRPINILQTLVSIAIRPNTPTCYITFPKRSAVSLRPLIHLGAGGIVWPPPRGYSISAWFQAHSYGEGNNDRSVISLFTFESVHQVTNTRTRIDATLFKGILTLRITHAEDNLTAGGPSYAHRSNAPAVHGSGNLVSTLVFPDAFFEEGQWYHILLSHTPLPSSKKKRDPDSREPKKGEVILFINGKRLRVSVPSPPGLSPHPGPSSATSPATSPAGPSGTAAPGSFGSGSVSSSSAMRLPYPVPQLASSLGCLFGSPTAQISPPSSKPVSPHGSGNSISYSPDSVAAAHSCSWSLGNVVAFYQPIESDSEAFLLYCVGPNYIGGLASIKASSLFCYDIVDPANLDSFADAIDILQNISAHSISHLHDNILFFFSARDRLYATRDARSRNASFTSSPVPQPGIAPPPKLLVENKVFISGDVLLATRSAVKDVLYYAGGVSSIVYLIGTAHTEDHQKQSMCLLKNILEWNPINVQQMQQIGGYDIIARVMRRREWILDEEMLGIIFQFVGLSKSSKRGTFSEGVVANIEATQSLLLDWQIWKRAPDNVRTLLYKSLAEATSSTNEHANFNVAQLRLLRIRTSLLMMLEEDDFSFVLAQHVIVLLSHLMHDPWALADIKAIFRFLVATHSSTDTKPRCPSGVATHSNAYFNGITCGSRPTLKLLIRNSQDGADPDTFDMASSTSSLSSSGENWSESSSSASLTRGTSTPQSQDDRRQPKAPTDRPVRDLVLMLLLDTLGKSSPEVGRVFFELCNMEMLLALMQNEIESTRILLLRLLDTYLKQPPLAQRFKRAQGFQLLGEILRNFEVTPDILAVLLGMLLGKPTSYNILQYGLAQLVSPGAELVGHPESLSAILLAASSCFIKSDVQHSINKILQGLFLQSDWIKNCFVQNNIIDLLANLLIPDYEHRVGIVELHLQSGDDQSALNSVVEEDVLSFLKAISLYGCSMEQIAANYLQDSLVALNSLTLPLEYVTALQKKLIYSVVEFYMQNSLVVSPSTAGGKAAAQPSAVLIATFQKVSIFCANVLLFMDEQSQKPSERASGSAHSSILRLSRTPSSASLPGTPIRSPSGSQISFLASPGSPSVRQSSGGPVRPQLSPSASTASLSASTSSSTPNTPRVTKQLLFHEILQSFEDEDEGRGSMSRSSSGAALSAPREGFASSSDTDTPTPLISPRKHDDYARPGEPGTPIAAVKATVSASEMPAGPILPAQAVGEPSQTHTKPLAESTTSAVPLIVAPQLETPDTVEGAPNDPRAALLRTQGSTDSLTELVASDSTAAVTPPLVLPTEPSSGPTSTATTPRDPAATLPPPAFWQAPGSSLVIEDQHVFGLLIEAFVKYMQFKEKASTFERLRTSLRRKTVGVSSYSEFDNDMSWHLERLIHHIFNERTQIELPENARLIISTLNRVPDLEVADLFISHREFLSRFTSATHRYLSTLNDEVCNAAWAAWKRVLTETPSSITGKVVWFPANARFLGYGRGDESQLAFVSGVMDKIKKIDMVDKLIRKQWNESYKARLKDGKTVASAKISAVKQLTSGCSNKIIEVQAVITKPLYDFMKTTQDQERKVRNEWRRLIKRVTHERAIWAIDKTLVRWELDPIEGPMRMRLKLKPRRAHKHPIIGADYNLNMEKYSRDPKTLYTELDSRKVDLLKALETQIYSDQGPVGSETIRQYTLPPGERLLLDGSFKCSRITPFHKRDGELLIGAQNTYFVDDHQFKNAEEERRKYTSVRKHSTWSYEDIREIHKRRYLLKNNAMEIFLINGKTFLLAFAKKTDRDTAYETLTKMELPNFVNFDEEVFVSGGFLSVSTTDKWQKGLISNFEYLMHLNTLAGRSFNDLTQYPVFPFVLRDYTSSELNLSEPTTFRDLSKPMGAQDPARLEKFVEKYHALKDLNEKEYFYGSHYSNVGTVLHFLVRLEPFSSFFIEFQSGKFDVADRTFYSTAQTWELSSCVSQSDVKELIPEFFFLPEFLMNQNKFEFGYKQDGQLVDSVLLPPWAKNDPRTFVLKHLEALESDYVSEHLNGWIDLVFGFAQSGEAAITHLNLFHPYTYEGAVDIDKVTDQVEREAIITQINSYGQTPKQLFKKPHPSRSKSITRPEMLHSHPTKFGPVPVSKYSAGAVHRLYFNSSGVPFALAQDQEYLWPEGNYYLQWGYWEGSLITAISLKTFQPVFSLDMVGKGQPLDKISCVNVSKDGRVIVAGSDSGLARVWRMAPIRRHGTSPSAATPASPPPGTATSKVTSPASGASAPPASPGLPTFIYDAASGQTLQASSQGSQIKATPVKDNRPSAALTTTISMHSSSGSHHLTELSLVAVLDGHLDRIRCVKTSPEQSVFATGSNDGTVILWDQNRLTYIRQLAPHEGSVFLVDIHPYWGDVVAVCEGPEGSVLHLWSINGRHIAKFALADRICSVLFSTAKPGLGNNVVVTGHESGTIHIWSSIDLSPVHSFTQPHKEAVTALCLSEDNTKLLSGDRSGLVFCFVTKLSAVAQ